MLPFESSLCDFTSSLLPFFFDWLTLGRSASPNPSLSTSPASSSSSPSTPSSFETKQPPTLSLDQAPSQPKTQTPPKQSPLQQSPQQQQSTPPQVDQKAQVQAQVAAHAHALALAQMQAKQAIAQAEAQARADAMAAQVKAESSLSPSSSKPSSSSSSSSLSSSDGLPGHPSSSSSSDSPLLFTRARANTPAKSPTPPLLQRAPSIMDSLYLNDDITTTPNNNKNEGLSPVLSSSPSSSTGAPIQVSNKVYGTVFGTHRIRPKSGKYSASAPIPSLPNNPIPARAHNNTSPAAVDPITAKALNGEIKREEEEVKKEEVKKEVKKEEVRKEEEKKGLGGSAEITQLETSNNTPTQKRQTKAYTFFTTSTPRTPLPGEQMTTCESCGKEQRVTDRFCAGCGKKR